MEKLTVCPNCGAPIEGNRCIFCGYSAAEAQAARAETPRAQEPQAEKPKTPDFLSDKADFLNAEGQLKLGLMYLNGVGVDKDEQRAAELFKKAAEGGSREGMFRYAEALFAGKGVAPDREKAKAWFVEAGRLGHPGARMRLRDFSDRELNVVPEQKVSASFEQVVARVRPFCVEFTCYENGQPASQGSGCVLRGGVVLTNAHVICDLSKEKPKPYDKIYVNFDEKFDDNRYLVAPLAIDFGEDIALCAFTEEKPDLPEIAPQLAEDAEIVPGKEVFTIGNGLGRGLGISRGVISRDIEYNAYGHREVIRTDMSVNPGNSGGALFDMEGNVYGIMSFVATQQDHSLAYGMSYAVTADSVFRLIHAMLANEDEDE